MYTLLYSALKNVGDFLIYDRAKTLLMSHKGMHDYVEFHARKDSLDPHLERVNKTKAVIVVLDDDLEGRKTKSVIHNVEEQLQNSSSAIRTLFLFIDHDLKTKLSEKKLSLKQLRYESLFQNLETFIQQIAEDYYDPEVDILYYGLERALKQVDWNYDKGIIDGFEDEGGTRK